MPTGASAASGAAAAAAVTTDAMMQYVNQDLEDFNMKCRQNLTEHKFECVTADD